MKILKNPEIRGILTLVLIIVVVAGVMAATTGKLEQWFGITLFSGPQALDKIVFVSEKDGGADIYMMNPDGSDAIRVTEDAKPESTPAISTTGNKILFVADAGAMNQVFSIGVRGGRPSQVTTATGHKAEPGYSPNGKTMSFIASGKVYAATLDGNKLDPILPTPEEIRQSVVAVEGERGAQTLYSTYAWGPDGASIAGVTKDGSGNDYLTYLPSLDGESTRIPLAAPGTPVDIAHISWAAKKPVLAVAATVGKKGELVMFDAEAGKHGIIIAKEGLEFGKPAVSPDGSKIVICVNEKGKSGLISIDLTGGGITPLAMGVFENPVFSPAGDKVLATRVDGDKRDVVVIDPSDGQLTELTSDGKSYNAIWTPASEK